MQANAPMTSPPNSEAPSTIVLDPSVFEKKTCTVFRSASHQWSSANSRVFSSPIVDLHRLFASPAIFQSATSLVAIAGPADEALHLHHSHLVGMVVRGTAWLLTPERGEQDGTVERARVSVGDIVVIPQRAWHLFDCAVGEEMDYIALEISDCPIDYQKHWD